MNIPGPVLENWVGAEPSYIPKIGAYVLHESDVTRLKAMIAAGELPSPPIAELRDYPAEFIPVSRLTKEIALLRHE